ncbi:hypothetical protein Sjap_008452 [Stephania japonica]|uniref:Uncharacterized protein n=1 Tax=Stephania japonica TaxID=461633 RepID=A0AAP0PAW3_9MAGN
MVVAMTEDWSEVLPGRTPEPRRSQSPLIHGEAAVDSDVYVCDCFIEISRLPDCGGGIWDWDHLGTKYGGSPESCIVSPETAHWETLSLDAMTREVSRIPPSSDLCPTALRSVHIIAEFENLSIVGISSKHGDASWGVKNPVLSDVASDAVRIPAHGATYDVLGRGLRVPHREDAATTSKVTTSPAACWAVSLILTLPKPMNATASQWRDTVHRGKFL